MHLHTHWQRTISFFRHDYSFVCKSNIDELLTRKVEKQKTEKRENSNNKTNFTYKESIKWQFSDDSFAFDWISLDSVKSPKNQM